MVYFIILVLTLNILWFGMAFHYFWFKTASAAKLLLIRENRAEPYRSIVAHAIKFIGAFNFAFMLLSIFSLVRFHYPELDKETNAALFFTFFAAHFGQFLGNLPLALKERKGQQPLWPVLQKRMLFIFRNDFILAMLNLIISIYLIYQILN